MQRRAQCLPQRNEHQQGTNKTSITKKVTTCSQTALPRQGRCCTRQYCLHCGRCCYRQHYPQCGGCCTRQHCPHFGRCCISLLSSFDPTVYTFRCLGNLQNNSSNMLWNTRGQVSPFLRSERLKSILGC